MFADPSTGGWFILIGFLINAAAPPLAAWLPDAYPEATVTGGVILSAYTSKTAVYTLIRGFPGYEVLIVLGCIMAIYGIIYALLENDMRRILAYSIVNQVGFMVVGVGIGSEIALNGAVAHAFCHIIYKALLWMSAGAVLYMTSRTRCTDLGGLYKTMPWTLILGGIGALAISSVPGTSGFTSKTLILSGAADVHAVWAWLVLEIASAGVFLHAGIKFPYFVFFNQDVHKLRPKEAPRHMRLAMFFLAFLCIFLGIYPDPLYAILPYQEMFQQGHFTVYKLEKVVTQTQLLIFSGLVFFLFLPLLKRTNTISLDTDFFYRIGGRFFYRIMDKSLNSVNTWAYNLFVARITHQSRRFFKRGPRRAVAMLQARRWRNLSMRERRKHQNRSYRRVMLGAVPIGLTAFWAVILLFVLFFV
jgi:multicomponent Na+:H+ antiporter subunit D